MKNAASRKPHPRADELRELQAVAMRARRESNAFDSEFSRRYLQDGRLTRAGLVLVDSNARADSHPGTEGRKVAERQQTSDDYASDSRHREQLRHAALDAERAVKDLENAIAEDVDEASERVGLAAAIKQFNVRSAAASKLKDGLARANDAVTVAGARSHDAAAAVNAAIDYQARTFEAAFEQGFSADRDGRVRDARAVATDAADELAAATSAAEALRAKLIDAEALLQESREAMERLVDRILTAALPDLLNEAERLREELAGKRHVLRYLSRFAPQQMAQSCRTFLDRNQFPFESANEINSHAAVAPWLATREALKRDADAPLPTSGA
jgi:hypothetical protein